MTEIPNSPVCSVEALQQKTHSVLDVMMTAVKEFVADYCITFNMSFMPVWPGSHDLLQDHVNTINISTMEEPIRIKICCLHRPGLLRFANVDVLYTDVYWCCLVTICIRLKQVCTMVGVK